MLTTAYGYGYVMTGRGDPVLLESSKVTGRFFSIIARVAAAHPETEAAGERVVIGPWPTISWGPRALPSGCSSQPRACSC